MAKSARPTSSAMPPMSCVTGEIEAKVDITEDAVVLGEKGR